MNQKELLSLIGHYVKTRIIEQPLVRYFDQHGRWRNETIHPRIKIPEPLRMLMAKSRLPRHRIISHDPNGDILHASYVSSNTGDVRVGYVEIQGSLIVDADVPICAPHLQHVAGDFVSSTNAKIDFPELESVKGDIVLISCRDLNLPILKNVEGKLLIVGDLPPEIVSVGDRLGLYGAQAYLAKNLKYVGGACIVMKAKSLTMPVLKNVGGCFLCVGGTFEINANRLKSIGGDFLSARATKLNLYDLRRVEGDMDTSSAAQFYDPYIRLVGEWSIAPDAMMNYVKRKEALEVLRKRKTPYL